MTHNIDLYVFKYIYITEQIALIYTINSIYRFKLFIGRHPLLLLCYDSVGFLLQLRQYSGNCHAY